MASSIPNLRTLRTGRRGHALRGGRSGRTYDDDGEVQSIEAGRDAIIQQTDHDASSSRMSAVALNYLDDPFARAFLAPGEQIVKRYPIINRGTYVRTKAIDKLVARFLDAYPEQRKQIVSLGAGSDTRFFRLMTEQSRGSNVVYHELDFEANANQKRSILRQTSEMSDCIKKAEQQGSSYHLHAIDLRALTNKSPPIIPDLDTTLPTLILNAATSVLQYFTMNLAGPLALVLYEPVRPFDAFGKTMVTNLASRGIHLQTLKRYSSLDAQRQRLRLAGFSNGQGARDVHQLYEDDGWVSQNERERIEKLEWLDEVEEWKLLASHYCVAWGWRGELFGEAWNGIDGSRTSEEDDDVG
ncbi:carboxy methyl transferase for protein phosphatase 2A [Elasticomyces elasticus]|nr:carboxy methyl transferase for protein phosphatase 2A [Elasticomyces elasticus]KAK3665928.1 carboxy methyl transferase for protein phosphatase 2A [Elasticomyces elasticus]KAK4929400.1 carboxy methyl transferase for protein phosphatase 2A [Elasticomyces elasticus]KAK5764689.1 carboxy methyl transferase for protein phosphatase 2A [Elasticomyces elasticus]